MIDGGTETALEEAFNDISADPSVFGVIGLFDTRVSVHTARLAQTHGVPLLMMTHKSGITENDQIWRVFRHHSP